MADIPFQHAVQAVQDELVADGEAVGRQDRVMEMEIS
jgi:hypothetical protein